MLTDGTSQALPTAPTPPPAAVAPDPASPAKPAPPSAEPAKDGKPADPPPAATEQTPAPDAPKEDEGVLSKRFAALAKREKQLLEREKAAKTALNDPDFVAFKKAKEGARTDPIELLKAHGWEFNQVTEFLLNDKKLTPEQQVALLQKRLDDEAKAKEEQKKAEKDERSQKALARHREQIAEHVTAAGDDLELTRAYGDDAIDLVQEVISEHWGKFREILPIDKAAKAVEDWLETQAREKVLKSKRFAPKESATPAAGNETPKPALPPTLTQRATTPAPSVPDDTSQLSREESIRRAASMLVWNK